MSVERVSDDGAGGDVRSVVLTRLRSVRRSVGGRLARLYFGDWFVILLTLGAAAAAGSRLTGLVGAALSIGAGLTVAAAVTVANGDNPALRALGAGVAVIGGVLTAAVLAFTALLGVRSGATGLLGGLALAALGLASAGAFLTPTRDLGMRAVLRTLSLTGLSAAGVLAVLAVRVLPASDLRAQVAASASALAVDAAGAATSASVEFGLATFLLTLGVAAWALRSAISTLPFERFLPADRRDDVARLETRVGTGLSRTVRVGLGGGALAAVAAWVVSGAAADASPVGVASYVRVDVLAAALPDPLGAVVAGVLLSESLRTGLLVLTLAGVAVNVLTAATRSMRRGLGWVLLRTAAPVSGGAAFGVAVGAGVDDPALPARLAANAPEGVPPEVLALVVDLPLFAAANLLVVLAMTVFAGALFALLWLRGLLVLPERAGSAALASVGLFGVAVVAVVVGDVGLGLGVCVAALAVWDVGEYRTGLREDLPGTAPTLRVEVVHASASLVTGATVVGLAWGLFVWIVPLIGPPDPGTAAAGLVVVALVTPLLLTQVRG